jgi:hypothetical protein
VAWRRARHRQEERQEEEQQPAIRHGLKAVLRYVYTAQQDTFFGMQVIRKCSLAKTAWLVHPIL